MLFKESDYLNHIKKIITDDLIDWSIFEDKCILIIGSSGNIGTLFIDCLMSRNQLEQSNITIYVLEYEDEHLKNYFHSYTQLPNFKIISSSMFFTSSIHYNCDFVLDLSFSRRTSESHMKSILTTIEEVKGVLDYAAFHNVERILLLSSTEIYGNCLLGPKLISEDYNGYIDINDSNSCVIEGQRLKETLIQAYIQEFNLDIIIPRISEILKVIPLEKLHTVDLTIIDYYLCIYIFETVVALLFLLSQGLSGEAYNITFPDLDYKLKELCKNLDLVNDVSFLRKDSFKSFHTLFDNSKLSKIGWHPIFIK